MIISLFITACFMLDGLPDDLRPHHPNITESKHDSDQDASSNIVGYVEPSSIEILSPSENEYGRTDEETPFVIIVRDGIDSIEDLDIEFSSTHSTVLGSFCTPTIDMQAQTASCSALLDEGIHNITFSAINSLEEETTLQIIFPVYRPEQIDDDGDGYCEEPPCINVDIESLDTGSQDTGTTNSINLVDCDDNDANIAPNKLDYFNGIDDNCNGLIDEGDDDGDGYCEVQPCLTSITEVAPDANDEGMIDCDDSADYIYPSAVELPNQIDDDCDGLIDEGTSLYDDDGDGYTEIQGDCDDTNSAIFPGAPETDNNIDDNCDGIIDNN